MFKMRSKSQSNQNQKELKKQEIARKSVQDLIPLKAIENGLLITPDNQMVQCLKVSAINLELTSNLETNEVFEIYEGVLIGLGFPIQTTNLSMPVDLKGYVSEQESILRETRNPYRRMLQESYIDYARDIEVSEDIMQRQRFVIFSEQMKDDTPEIRYETMLEIEEKKNELISSLSELELTAEPVTDLEIVRYLHTLFDYNGAKNRPILDMDIPQTITGRK